MKCSIQDPSVQVILETQLRAGRFSWLDIKPVQDFFQGENQFAVFFANMSRDDKSLDAWLVMGGGSSGYYTFENYPTIRDAVCQHIGRLVLEGKFSAQQAVRD